MTENEHLLTIAAEECVEVAQRLSKALRFGLTEVQPGQGLDNAERIMVEFDDLQAVIMMLQARRLLPSGKLERIFAKKEKVHHFLVYSATQGTLTKS
jgi:hypothetical protein